MPTEKEIQEMLTKLREQRTQVLVQAERTLGMIDGQIMAFEKMLEPKVESKDD